MKELRQYPSLRYYEIIRYNEIFTCSARTAAGLGEISSLVQLRLALQRHQPLLPYTVLQYPVGAR